MLCHFKALQIGFVWALLALMGWMCCSTEGVEKQIRLRNALISTSDRPPTVQPLGKEPLVSGLYLVQFKKVPSQDVFLNLSALGVKALRYVPDDAYIVRLENASAALLRNHPDVQWVGSYRSDYKLFAGLVSSSTASGLVPVDVRVLLTPDAKPEDLAEIGRWMSVLERQSPLRSGAILQGKVAPERLKSLSESQSVLWIEPVEKLKLYDEVSTKIVEGNHLGHSSAVQALGFDGQGVTVAVVDSGLDSGISSQMHPDIAGRVDALFYYGQLKDAADRDGHGTHVAGIIAGNGATGEADENGQLYGLGVAPGAHLVAQSIIGYGGRDESPANKEQLTRDAYQAGARIASNSWGGDSQGRYDLNAAEYDGLVRDADRLTDGDQPLTLVFSAGNAGPGSQTISTPGSAKNVITVGASLNDRYLDLTSESPNSMASMSSRGPCEDGRIKPDLSAPGTMIASLQSSAAGGSAEPISESYQYMSGTSQACPHVAGAAAVFIQYYRQTHNNGNPSPALVKAALINAAADMDDAYGTGPVPNEDEGWGRVDLAGMIGSNRRYDFLDQAVPLATGQSFVKNVLAASSSMPLKITLVYTDCPGLPSAIPALVNNLDLVVTGPDGTCYRGNQLDQGESIPNPAGADNLNNVEMVRIPHPIPGEYLVKVSATRVVEDACRDTLAIDQDFALVTSGDLPLPGEGIIILDRSLYSAPGSIGIKLIDFDLSDRPSAPVIVSCGSQAIPLALDLKPFNNIGVFTGSVVTVKAPQAVNDSLTVQHGDRIDVTYADAWPTGLRTARALVDLLPPIISDVTVTNRNGKAAILWKTDEAATSLVRYTTNRIDYLLASEAQLSQSHSASLNNLPAGATNRFEIICTDAAGNSATNDNNGQWFTHLVAFPSVVLLVNDYVADDSSEHIPVTTYTDALDRIAISYDIWNPADKGGNYPNQEDLANYKIVIWRVNDSFYSPKNSIPVEEQYALQSYLNKGGSLFIASMEILSRMETFPFVANVLQVASFDPDATVSIASGVKYDVIAEGMDIPLDFAAYPTATFDVVTIGPDISDNLMPTTNAAPIFLAPSGKPAGLRYPRTGNDSPGRVVFLAFPLETVPLQGESPNNRADLLLNIVSFLAPGINGFGTIAFDNATYTIPSRVVIEISDSDLAGRGKTTVNIWSDFENTPQVLTLDETVRPGLFRGFFTLAPATNAPAPGQLRALDQDNIVAEYFDASSKRIVRTRAVADVVPPVIDGLTFTPGYTEVKVEWNTSKLADSLVQFGESSFLGYTAYDHLLTDKHSILLKGLLPDRLYYCQAVSRDEAGNRVIDNNDGQFFLFRTLKPLKSPWEDRFEPPSTNWPVIVAGSGIEWQLVSTNNDWTVLNSPTTGGQWQLGPPANGRETNAISTNCWGSNLNGLPLAAADTSLVSPAIELKGGNAATLTFHHNYDFTPRSDKDWDEAGLLFISTNNGAAWTKLAKFNDVSDGWETAHVDLTPYLNRIVRLKWQYILDSLDALERPGWLVASPAIAVGNLQHGDIEVSNNLFQATFTLTGPVTRQGQGWSAIFANVPVGQYVVTFKPVAYYLTPAPMTNILTATKSLRFDARYGMTDANANSMPDEWELEHFGTVDDVHLSDTDTDADGASDLAEFIAGTNPTDASSCLRLAIPLTIDGNRLRLEWPSVPGRAYRIESATDIGQWKVLSDWMNSAGTSGSYELDAATNTTVRFFRLAVRP
jgi:subtilisin family serine protease